MNITKLAFNNTVFKRSRFKEILTTIDLLQTRLSWQKKIQFGRVYGSSSRLSSELIRVHDFSVLVLLREPY